MKKSIYILQLFSYGGLFFYLFFTSCDTPDVSNLSNVLLKHKTKTTNLLHLFAENCKSNKEVYNEAVLLYSKAQTTHNLMINKIISDIRNNKEQFTHQQIEEELSKSYEFFYQYTESSIKNNCNPEYSKKIPLGLLLNIAQTSFSLYQDFESKFGASKIIDDLKSLELPPYYEIVSK